MSNHESQFDRRGVRWEAVLKILTWLAPLVAAAAIVALRGEFATVIQIEELSQHVVRNSSDIRSLQEFKVRAEINQTELAKLLQGVTNEQFSTRAVLAELVKSSDKMSERIEKLSDQLPYRKLGTTENK